MPFLLVWWVSCLATLSFPLSAGSVFAQQVAIAEEEEIIETREVIVSATKTEIPAKQVTSAVEVMTGEQIQQRNVKTVAEALRWAQGLGVFQSGGPGTVVDVRMRGIVADRSGAVLRRNEILADRIGAVRIARYPAGDIIRRKVWNGLRRARRHEHHAGQNETSNFPPPSATRTPPP